MAGKFSMKMLGAALLVLFVAGLSGCTFRDAPPWDKDEMKTKMQQEDWAKKQSVEDLEKRVSELEQRADDNAAAAEKAQMTADKALKCCRKEYDVIMTEEIHFDFNKFTIRPDDYAALDRVAAKLKEDPDLICECKGHTDGIGNVDYNIVLGQKRADAARMYLIDKHNISMGRIAIRTFGEDAPIASNDTEEGRAKNRRVTIDVLGFAE
jgi:outer membrane protein OmpA-like peptidoglycan-associated protein